MDPGTWSGLKGFLINLALSVMAMGVYFAVYDEMLSPMVGTILLSILVTAVVMFVMLGPLLLRIIVVPLIAVSLVDWSTLPTLATNGGTVKLFNPNDIGGVTMWFWLILAAFLIVFFALGYRLGFGSTDNTKSDIEVRVYKKKGENKDLRLAFGLFLWRKGHN